MTLQGHLENIHEDGLITGWCWDPDHPTTRARLTVLVDNEPIGELIADNFRQDLEAAGLGDGAHAFAFLLPWSAIASKSVTSIHVADPANNSPIGGALTFRRSALLPVEQRIAELEHGARLLEARIVESNRHADRTTALVQSTLATIGAFFTQLAEMPLETLAQPGSAGIGRLLTAARKELEPFAFAMPSEPVMTICISGPGSLHDVYGCLRALKACGIDEEAEIVFIDAGFSQDTGLIPLLVHNIRYWSVGEAQSLLDARNQLGTLGMRDMLLFIGPAVRMRDGWLDAAKATFAAHPRCAVLGSTVLHADGSIQSSALMNDHSGRLIDFGYAEMPEVCWHNRLAPVAAVPDHALLIRQLTFREVDGFDPAYGDLAAAATDLCLRCWDADHSVLYQPALPLRWQHDPSSGALVSGARDLELDALLADRWRRTSRLAWPSATQRALIVDEVGGAAGTTCLQSAQALQTLGYDVAFANVAGLDAEDAAFDALRFIGVEVLKAPYHPSVIAAIKAETPAFDIIQLSPAAASYLSPETIRALSPNSRTIMVVDEAAVQRLAAADQEDTGLLVNALMRADAIITLTDRMQQALPFGIHKKAARAVLMPKTPLGRSGVWLLLDGPEAATQDAGRWLSTLLPSLMKAVPGCAFHTVQRDGLRLPASVTQHPVSLGADGDWLRRMRVALAPFRLAAVNPESVATCLVAGLPVIATAPALDGDAPPKPGVVEVAANGQAIGRLLRSLEDTAAWEELASPLHPSPTIADWVATYSNLGKSLKRAVT